MMEKNKKLLIKMVKYAVDIMFWGGIFVEILLPLFMKTAGKFYSSSISDHYWSMTAIFFAAGICGIVIVANLRKMMGTVVSENCFVRENVNSLKKMGKMAFIISGLFVVKLFVLPTPATFVIIITFFIAGMFSLVLSLVFDEAVRYKEENDLTI